MAADSVNRSEMVNHRVGEGSYYDVDVDVIELYVKCHASPSNSLVQSSVFNTYIGKVLEYWTIFRSNLEKGMIKYEEKVDRSYYIDYYGTTCAQKPWYPTEKKDDGISVSKYIETHIDKYEQKLMEMIDTVSAKFKESTIFDIVDVLALFIYVAELACLIPNPAIEGLSRSDLEYVTGDKEVRNIFLLTNYSGHFGFNAYLFAFVNNLHLIGIPSDVSSYDRVTTCPTPFISHDLRHIQNQGGLSHYDLSDHSYEEWLIGITGSHPPLEYRKHIDTIYYRILNDLSLDKLHRHALLLSLWIRIHEGYNNDFVDIDNDNYMLGCIATVVDTDIDSLLKDEFKSFAPFVTDKFNLDLTIRLYEHLIHNYIRDVLLSKAIDMDYDEEGFKEIEEMIRGSFTVLRNDISSNSYTLRSLYLLTMVHFYNYTLSSIFGIRL